MRGYLIRTMLAVALLFTLSACSNTMHGMGRDIENAGEKIQKTF